MFGDHFASLRDTVSHDYHLTIEKLKMMPSLLVDEREQLIKLISSSSSVDGRRISSKIITYLIVKLCYNDSSSSTLVRLCNVMGELINPKDSAVCLQRIRHGKYVAMYVHILLVKEVHNYIYISYN